MSDSSSGGLSTLQEDLLSNTLLAIVLILFSCARDFCRRVSKSDCVYDTDNGLHIKLPTYRRRDDSDEGGGGENV